LSTPSPTGGATAADAAEVLRRLKDGNRRFVGGTPQHAHTSEQWRRSLAAGQHPIAIVVGCSDSRVPVEIVFDQGLGDLFVVRNAGNVLDTQALGSIEFAVSSLNTPLLVVLGHEQCGAVTAALDSRASRELAPPELQQVLRMIDPALEAEGLRGTDPATVAAGVEANVRWSVEYLNILRDERGAALSVTVAGAIYELESGRVRFLDD
jgi:carbonic anhydrase